MKVSEILKLIPDEELDFLSAETKVDFQVKKLTGMNMFKLLLFAMLHSDKPSLRVLESYYRNVKFKALTGIIDDTAKFNSIRDRICNINAVYFERIFKTVFNKFSANLNEQHSLIRFDSTMVAISSNLIDWGMKVGHKTNKKQIKYTIGMKGSLPCHVSIFGTQKELSEDKTISHAVFSYASSSESIVVFDRGVQARNTFDIFTDDDIQFVTRIKTDVVYKIKTSNKISSPTQDGIQIYEDSIVQLKSSNGKPTKHLYRLIKARKSDSKEDIFFLTNITECDSYLIAHLYKMRWEIEVLFKFLKQELNLNHLVSRHKNGIKVMILMTLITAILLIAYKKLNGVKSYKLAKLEFSNELESSIMKQVVILCGGDPTKAPHLFNDE